MERFAKWDIESFLYHFPFSLSVFSSEMILPQLRAKLFPSPFKAFVFFNSHLILFVSNIINQNKPRVWIALRISTRCFFLIGFLFCTLKGLEVELFSFSLSLLNGNWKVWNSTCPSNVDSHRTSRHYMNMVYRINMKPKLRSVAPPWNGCMYITPPMVVAKALSEPEIGCGLGSNKWSECL